MSLFLAHLSVRCAPSSGAPDLFSEHRKPLETIAKHKRMGLAAETVFARMRLFRVQEFLGFADLPSLLGMLGHIILEIDSYIGGEFGESYASCGPVGSVIPVDTAIRDCSPAPVDLLRSLPSLAAPEAK
ncbi:hypothetical protein ACWJKU_12945 [Methylocaldum sp. MU1018]